MVTVIRAVTRHVDSAVMGCMVPGLIVRCLMVEIGMHRAVLVAGQRSMMSVMVCDLAVLGPMRQVGVVCGMRTTSTVADKVSICGLS